MKKIFFIILITAFFGCKKETENTDNKPNIETKADLTIASKNFEKYLKHNAELFEYQIVGIKDSLPFSDAEISFPLKENEFHYNKSKDFNYFEAKSFENKNNKLKIIIYNTYGENDLKVLNIQLNSYNSGQLVDALLLDCRFTFETEYFRNFKINSNAIEIKKFNVDKLLYNEEGDIIGNKPVNDTVVNMVKYKLNDKGFFVKQ